MSSDAKQKMERECRLFWGGGENNIKSTNVDHQYSNIYIVNGIYLKEPFRKRRFLLNIFFYI